jgi:ATP-dependent Lon protease
VMGVRRGQPTARPGEILDGLRRAGARDPVFLLDEIDALGADEVNDPAGALVEAHDPESSCAFLDAYLGIPFDVSRVFFVATAGVVYDVPRAVRERLDVITLAGYTPDEKFLIARRSLLPRALDRAGLDPAHVTFTDEALEQVVNGYTREAGVRSLARSLSRITRTLALRLRQAGKVPEQVDAAQVSDLLGPAPYEDDPLDREPVVGLATGLSWTADGGVVQLIEATAMEGTGRIVVTGRLGDVMRESADIAYSWVRAHGASLGLEDARMQRLDLHIHAPEGGVRKDGPSAGVALATAIVSVFTGRAVLPDVAMTGELTLRGRVLDVAGIREKVSAAQRAGVHHVLLPGQNRKDVAMLPAALTRKMRFEFFDRIEDYLAAALVPAAPRA